MKTEVPAFPPARILFDAVEVQQAIQRIARQIDADLSTQAPLCLMNMQGGLFFAGQLLPLLAFPLEIDYIQTSRYQNAQQGGDVQWIKPVPNKVQGRVVLLLDDVLDEGHTLSAIELQVKALGASACYTAVLVNKQLPQSKSIQADYIGLQAPNLFLFGCGMDMAGYWRNLPALYALEDR